MRRHNNIDKNYIYISMSRLTMLMFVVQERPFALAYSCVPIVKQTPQKLLVQKKDSPNTRFCS